MAEPEFEDVYRALSSPTATDGRGLSRRRFLQAVAGVGGAMAVPGWMAEAAAAASASGGAAAAAEGVLVVVLMGGGNDGLNTVVPLGSGAYHDLRGDLAISETAALPLDAGHGLHPALTTMKARFDAGNLAVVRGVGVLQPDLSHFTSMATWMSGGIVAVGPPTGWLGRYLDALNPEAGQAAGVSIGSGVPLHLKGRTLAACAMPNELDSAFGATADDDVAGARLVEAARSYAAAPTGRGQWGDALAQANRAAVDLAQDVRPHYLATLPEDGLARRLTLCARLINANVGARVLGASLGSFDTHANQLADHGALMAELDAGVAAFFASLDPVMAARVTLMTFSEFGRRAEANGSAGTDHGTAGALFLTGAGVRGGLHGVDPSLTDLTDDGNLTSHVDFRSVYATVLERWLGADPVEVLAGNHEQLDLFAAAPAAPASPPGRLTPRPPGAAPARVKGTDGYRLATQRGQVVSFGHRPDRGQEAATSVVAMATTPSGRGYWLATRSGSVLAFGDASHHGDAAGVVLLEPVVDMAASPTGLGYLLVTRDGRVLGYGDCRRRKARAGTPSGPVVVGLAPTPTGLGYWLVAVKGKVFPYGDAAGFGSLTRSALTAPVAAIAATPSGSGYWLALRNGRIHHFGDAAGVALGAAPSSPVVGLAVARGGRGCWLACAGGQVLPVGNAVAHGSATLAPGSGPVVAVA